MFKVIKSVFYSIFMIETFETNSNFKLNAKKCKK